MRSRLTKDTQRSHTAICSPTEDVAQLKTLTIYIDNMTYLHTTHTYRYNTDTF